MAARTTKYHSSLKILSQSTKPLKVKERVADLDFLAGLYVRLDPVIKVLGLSHEGIQYYANSVIKSEIFQITRSAEEDRYLHAIAFVAHQYYRLQDNLIDVLLINVQRFNIGVERRYGLPVLGGREIACLPNAHNCGRMHHFFSDPYFRCSAVLALGIGTQWIPSISFNGLGLY